MRQSDETGNRSRWSCCAYGCAAVLVIVLAVIAWGSSAFFIWQKNKIPLPDGSGSVIYMSRLRKILCAEWDRKLCFDTKHIKGNAGWLPMDTCGAWPVNVYWYAKKNGKGPYLRFQDPLNEYMADLKSGKTLLVVRHSGSIFVGEISNNRCEYEISSCDGDVEVAINGKPGVKLDPSMANSHGTYLGRINHPRYGFISSKAAPEESIPEY